IARMRVLAAGQATTEGAFALTEFTGGEGSWTVPHVHRETQESFFVLDGEFTFTVGDEEIPASPGSYILVPRGTRHTITAGGARPRPLGARGGGGDLFPPPPPPPRHPPPPPATRAAISTRHDSIPV